MALAGALLLLPTAALGFPQAGPLAGAAALLVIAAAPLARRYTDLVPDETATTRSSQGRAAVSVHWPSLLTLTIAMVGVGAVFGAVQTGAAAYAAATGTPQLAGVYFAELGIGSAVAGAACAWLPQRFGLTLRRWVFPVALTVGMGVLLWGAAHDLLPLAIAVGGLTVGPYMVTLYSLIEAQTPLSAMATAMAVLCAGGPIGTAAGQFLAGLLVDAHGPTTAFVLAPAAAGVGLAASLLNAIVRTRRGDKGAPESTAPANTTRPHHHRRQLMCAFRESTRHRKWGERHVSIR